MGEWTHFDENGNAVMVDIHQKEDSYRIARAGGKILVNESVYRAIENHTAKKGDVLGTARIAGIMAAKKNAELIPLCHIIALTDCEINFSMNGEADAGSQVDKSEKRYEIFAECKTSCIGKTGVEMEALTGLSVALLTIYDMCKAMDRAMEITGIRLLEKDGGKSGHYTVQG